MSNNLTWRDTVNRVVGVERIQDLSSYVKEKTQVNMSPIDVFYDEIKSITIGVTPDKLNANDWLGPLYVIAIVSSTENYFRHIFSRILKICTDSQKNAASNTVNLGSVIWHPKNEIERGAFEHTSMASSENVVSIAKKYIGVDLKANSLGLTPILDEFDKVCELRHGIVHSGRIMAGKNGIKLQFSPSENIISIDIRYAQLQEVSAVCSALVVSSNKILFEELSRRWATSWRKSPAWSRDKENFHFKNIWYSFHSETDKTNEDIALECTWVKCRNLIKKEYNV